MSNSAVNKLFECHGTGEVTRGNVEDTVVPAETSTPVVKQEFDENVIANGLVDSPKEGGTSIARSTGTTGMDDKAVPGSGLGFKNSGSGPYELLGFTVRYNVPDSMDVGSTEVQVNFPSIEDAQKTISRDGSLVVYSHTTPAGVNLRSELILGAPTICVNECEKLKFIEDSWIRP